jgi:hypothetical protein
MTHNTRIISFMEKAIAKIKNPESDEDLYATLRALAAVANNEAKKVKAELGLFSDEMDMNQ